MLTEQRRQQLDGIVDQMIANKESDNAITFVVNDFKNRYSEKEPQKSFTERTADMLDMFFGGGKIGEAIGTKVGKYLIPEEQRQFYDEALPTGGELAGSALQSAALFIPGGKLAGGITSAARAIGLRNGVSALGKVGSGILAGEIFDLSANLQNGKTGTEALTPGLGVLIGGSIPATGVVKNITVRFGNRSAPRIINSLIKPLAKDFSYGKNPGRAVAEEGIVANNFDDLLTSIQSSRQKIGQEIGSLSNKLSRQPLLDISKTLSPIDDAIKTAASQNNTTVLHRLNNVKRAITDVLEPVYDDAGGIGVRSSGSRRLDGLTFKEARNILGDIGDMTAFTGNPSDDKLVNSALKRVYGNIKKETLGAAEIINPQLAKQFKKATEKYADLHSAEIATRYRDKIVERQNLIGLNPLTAGIGTGLITAVATGGATIPSILVGVSGAAIDKLAGLPGFKTRLAYILSKKSPQEVSYLFKKVPVLTRFFTLRGGATPGDVLLGRNAKNTESSIAGYIENTRVK